MLKKLYFYFMLKKIVSGGEDRIMTVSDYNGDTKFEVKFMILDNISYFFSSK